MCGLFGFQLLESDDRMAVVVGVLAAFMDKRGGHSWGFYADGVVKRGLGDWCDNMPARNVAMVKTLMAHTRFATTGAKTEENAHPLRVGKIIGCHNGVVYNDDELDRKYHRTWAVDSTHIFDHIDKALPMSEVQSYGAVTWLSTEHLERINYARFNNGDFAVARLYTDRERSETTEPVGTVWASTQEALTTALGVAGWSYDLVTVEEGVLYYVQSATPWDSGEKFDISPMQFTSAFSGRVGGSAIGSHWWDDEDDGKDDEKDGKWAGHRFGWYRNYQHRSGKGDKKVDGDNVIALPDVEMPPSILDDLTTIYGRPMPDSRCESCDEVGETYYYPELSCFLCGECIADLEEDDDGERAWNEAMDIEEMKARNLA